MPHIIVIAPVEIAVYPEPLALNISFFTILSSLDKVVSINLFANFTERKYTPSPINATPAKIERMNKAKSFPDIVFPYYGI